MADTDIVQTPAKVSGQTICLCAISLALGIFIGAITPPARHREVPIPQIETLVLGSVLPAKGVGDVLALARNEKSLLPGMYIVAEQYAVLAGPTARGSVFERRLTRVDWNRGWLLTVHAKR